MIGAIIGDIVGSRFEFDNFKSKDFEMFDSECSFTDDTVMTLAIAKALQLCDTIAAITGSIAEAFYGVDGDMKETAFSYLDTYLLDIADNFVNKFIKKEI